MNRPRPRKQVSRWCRQGVGGVLVGRAGEEGLGVGEGAEGSCVAVWEGESRGEKARGEGGATCTVASSDGLLSTPLARVRANSATMRAFSVRAASSWRSAASARARVALRSSASRPSARLRNKRMKSSAGAALTAAALGQTRVGLGSGWRAVVLAGLRRVGRAVT